MRIRVFAAAVASAFLLAGCGGASEVKVVTPTTAPALVGYNDHTFLESELVSAWNSDYLVKENVQPSANSVACIKSGQTMNCRFELNGSPSFVLAAYTVSEDGKQFFSTK